MEYADITDPSWYVHSTYQSGYTYKNRVLGHHAGGGGKDLYLEQGLFRTDRLNGTVKFDYEERGVTTRPVTERRYQAGTDWRFDLRTMIIPWTIQTDFAYEWVRNAGHTLESNRENALVTFTFVDTL